METMDLASLGQDSGRQVDSINEMVLLSVGRAPKQRPKCLRLGRVQEDCAAASPFESYVTSLIANCNQRVLSSSPLLPKQPET